MNGLILPRGIFYKVRTQLNVGFCTLLPPCTYMYTMCVRYVQCICKIFCLPHNPLPCLPRTTTTKPIILWNVTTHCTNWEKRQKTMEGILFHVLIQWLQRKRPFLYIQIIIPPNQVSCLRCFCNIWNRLEPLKTRLLTLVNKNERRTNWFGLFHFHDYLNLTFSSWWLEIQNSEDRIKCEQPWEENKGSFLIGKR